MGVGIGVGSAIGNEAPTYTRKGGGVGDCEGGWLEHPRRWPDAQRWADGLASRRRRAEPRRCRGGALTVLPHGF